MKKKKKKDFKGEVRNMLSGLRHKVAEACIRNALSVG